MRTSKFGREMITKLEGFMLRPYRDPVGYWTIGVGHLFTKSELSSGKVLIGGKNVVWREGITEEQVDDLLSQDLARFEDAVRKVEVPLTQNQFDALVSFAFNVGTGAFARSTLLSKLNQGHYDQVPAQLRRWVFAGGRVLKGLVKRRETEVAMWNGTYVTGG